MTEKKTTKKKSPTYKVILHTDTLYKGEGETFQEAFLSMGLTWNMIKLKGSLEVKKGKKKVEQLFSPYQLKCLINRKMLRDIWAGKFDLRLK